MPDTSAGELSQPVSMIWTPSLKHRLVVALLLVSGVFLTGTIGYMLIEDWSIGDSFYMTVISMTTVGFAEVHPLSSYGRIFTGFIIIGGFSILGYTAGMMATSIIENEFPGRSRERRMRNAIDGMRSHVIVCGYGKVGNEIARELTAEGVPQVFIEMDPLKIQQCEAAGHRYIQGDATEDETLVAAGVQRAHALVAALDDDAQNVFITLSARVLNPDLLIITRAASPRTEMKLKLAGANHIVSPYSIAGRRIAGFVARPGVVSFLDTVLSAGELEFYMEEIIIGADSDLVNCSLESADIRKSTGAMVLAVINVAGPTFTNPPSDFILKAGDSMIVIGTRNQLLELAHRAKDNTVDIDLKP